MDGEEIQQLTVLFGAVSILLADRYNINIVTVPNANLTVRDLVVLYAQSSMVITSIVSNRNTWKQCSMQEPMTGLIMHSCHRTMNYWTMVVDVRTKTVVEQGNWTSDIESMKEHCRESIHDCKVECHNKPSDGWGMRQLIKIPDERWLFEDDYGSTGIYVCIIIKCFQYPIHDWLARMVEAKNWSKTAVRIAWAQGRRTVNSKGAPRVKWRLCPHWTTNK